MCLFVFIIVFSKSYFLLFTLMNPSLFTLLYSSGICMCVFVFIIRFSMPYFLPSTLMKPSLFTLLYSFGICMCLYLLLGLVCPIFSCDFLHKIFFYYSWVAE